MEITPDAEMTTFLAEALSPEEWAARAWEEARGGCEECRRRDDAFAERRAEEAWLDPARWPAGGGSTNLPPAASEGARGEFARLRDAPAGQRLAALERVHRAGHHPGLAELLLAEGRKQLREKAAEAREWLDCAEAAAHLEPEDDDRARRLLRIAAERAAVLRVLGELTAAAELWTLLTAQLARLPLAGPGQEALFWRQAAGLCAARRDFPAAAARLDRAERLLRLAGDPAGAAATLTERGTLAERAGASRTAVRWLLRAAAAIDPLALPRLFCVNQTRLAASLVAVGDPGEAQRVLASIEAVFHKVSEANLRRRRDWVEGRIALATRNWKLAETRLRTVRQDSKLLNRHYELALLQLDFACLYLAAGQPTLAAAAAQEMTPLLKPGRLCPHLADAIRHFQAEAAAGRADAPLVADLARYIPLVRRDPAYPFRRGEILTPPPPPDDAP